MNTTRHNQTRKTERIKAFVGFVVMNGHNQIAPDKPRFHLITRRSEVQVLLPQPSWVTKMDTLTWNPWEIRGFTVFMAHFFKACFIDTQSQLRALGRTWTKFSADLACFMAGFTLSDTFYCSSFLNNLKLFIEEAGITFWYQPPFSLSNP